MNKFWIGDFRCKILQQLYKTEDQMNHEHQYIIDDLASYSWFITSVFKQLEQISPANSDIIIMLGLLDCIDSCTWSSLKINRLASDYANSINTLIDSYPDNTFYVCSVNPVDGDYSSSFATNGLISAKSLNTKIEAFNDILKSACKATFINSYDYLIKTNFNTYDGIHYTQETSRALQNFIISNLIEKTGSTFIPRLTAPIIDGTDASADFWVHTSKGGSSPFEERNTVEGYKNVGSTLPNCTAYAWGRFYEIIGERPKLSQANAEYWYDTIADGYKRGETPALGAVMCWQNGDMGGDGAGHVAIVEQINIDGSIVTSESGYSSSNAWWLTNRKKGADNNWGMSSPYKFQGFIYCPQTTAAVKEDLCTRNSYNILIEEMKPNARYIWQHLGARGWTLNAVAGLLGNLQQESKMSPNVWESLISGSIINSDGTQTLNMTAINQYYANKGRYPGYGLAQWTPYSKYTDWCKSNKLDYWDIDSQLQRIDFEAEKKIQWIAEPSKGYGLSFAEFITSTKDAYWLAGAFAFCYERPARSTGTITEQNDLRKERGEYGEFWYNYLKGLPFIIPDIQLKVDSFKIDESKPTQVSASFLACNGTTGKYTLSMGKNVILSKQIDLENSIKTFTIKNLKPNTGYKLKLEIRGVNEKSFSKEISFTTPQEYPESIKSITLTYEDLLKASSGIFKLNVVKPTHIGYWSSNCGYDIQLIVNNKHIKNKTTNIKNFSSYIFDIKKEFNYNCKTGDIIQIGIRVWVKDDKGNKFYDDVAAKTSKPICLLNKPVNAYLNID